MKGLGPVVKDSDKDSDRLWLAPLSLSLSFSLSLSLSLSLWHTCHSPRALLAAAPAVACAAAAMRPSRPHAALSELESVVPCLTCFSWGGEAILLGRRHVQHMADAMCSADAMYSADDAAGPFSWPPCARRRGATTRTPSALPSRAQPASSDAAGGGSGRDAP
jgi:hypothetical protein